MNIKINKLIYILFFICFINFPSYLFAIQLYSSDESHGQGYDAWVMVAVSNDDNLGGSFYSLAEAVHKENGAHSVTSVAYASGGPNVRAESQAKLIYEVDFFTKLRLDDSYISGDYDYIINSSIPIYFDYMIYAHSTQEVNNFSVAGGYSHAILSAKSGNSELYVDTGQVNNDTVIISGREYMNVYNGYLLFDLYAMSLISTYTGPDSGAYGAAYSDPSVYVDENYEFYDFIDISFKKFDPLMISAGINPDIPKSVPEPSSAFLFGSGLAGLSWRYRRRKKG